MDNGTSAMEKNQWFFEVGWEVANKGRRDRAERIVWYVMCGFSHITVLSNSHVYIYGASALDCLLISRSVLHFARN